MIKAVTLSVGADELRPMLPLIRRLYFGREVEGLSILWGQEEWDLDANPFIQRYYSEYSTQPQPTEPDGEWLGRAARRVVLEERPDILVIPNQAPFYRKAAALVQELGGRVLWWPDAPVTHPPDAAVDAVGLLEPKEQAPLPLRSWQELILWLPVPPAQPLERSPTLSDEAVLDSVWESLQSSLPEGPIAWQGRPLPRATEGTPVAGLHLLELARSPDPAAHLRAVLEKDGTAIFLETVNLPVTRGRHTFRYQEYDNEFALGPATHDLSQLCQGLSHRAVILNPGSGSAEGDGPLEAPEGPRVVMLTVSRQPLPEYVWWERYKLPDPQRMKIVLVDSMNMAGSLANHCLTINRHTQHQATGLHTEDHPWISYPKDECRLELLTAEPSSAVRKALEEADGFIFFEDDDENSAWPIDLKPYVLGKPVVHLYVGYRVHRQVARMQRPGRRVLTPLPHIKRMIPRANFYAGFPPASLYDVPLREPLSAEDGILRVLHTASMPHKTLSRFVYHKDTEAFLAAARELKDLRPDVEFWQMGGLPHRQIMEARQLCDITFNHLRGYISLAADEALYFGRALVHAFDQCSINRHKEYWGLDTSFPWLTATPRTLANVLGTLLGDRDLRERLGREGHAFIQRYFAPELGILPLIWHLSQAEVACEA